MNYDQFLENLSTDIKAALEPELGTLHIEIRDVEKLSGQSYTGLMIRKESENIAMSMNLTKQFEQLEQGRPYIAITNEVIGEVTHYEARIKAARKAEIEAMKAEIRQEDQEKGVFYVVADCPEGEPTVVHVGEVYDGRNVLLPAGSM